MTYYGQCMRMMDDMPNPASFAVDIDVLIQDVYHLLTTRRGTMATKPDFGFGLSDEILAGRTPDTMPALASSIQSALEDDDRITLVDVDLTFEADGHVIITISIDATNGASFRLVGPLSSLTAELING